MKWNDVQPDISSESIYSLFKKMPFIDVIKVLILSSSEPIILIRKSIREKIYHQLSQKKVEMGGLLIGKVYSKESLKKGIVATYIYDAYLSEDYQSTPTSLTMNQGVWQIANENAQKEGAFVVGWYHSHPNIGAFFSHTDRKTQKNFFNQIYSLGFVVDPYLNQEKWFRGKDSKEVGKNQIIEIPNFL